MNKRQKFTDSELKKAFEAGGKTYYGTARVLNVTPWAVQMRCEKIGLKTAWAEQDTVWWHEGEHSKITAWDIETLPIKAVVWNTGEQRINSVQILEGESTSIACAAWQEEGGPVRSASLLEDIKSFKKDYRDDRRVVTAIHAMLTGVAETSGILLYQNGDSFDLKKVMARIIYHGLPPLPKIRSIDTLRASRSIAAFDANNLDYLDKHFGGEGKIPNRGMDMWRDIVDTGKPIKERIESLRQLTEYNKGDLPPLWRVYAREGRYMGRAHPNRAIGRTECCTFCGSRDYEEKTGRFLDRATGRFPLFRCKSKHCGNWFAGVHRVAHATVRAT